jgi:ornithine cyclodeaminase
MLCVSETASASIINMRMAYEAVRSALQSAVDERSTTNGLIVGQGMTAEQSFAVKSATIRSENLVGLKVGSYWPHGDSATTHAHSSTVILLDPVNGRVEGVICGSTVNGFRTAAADAVAVSLLARENASSLAVIGAGNQASYEVAAICAVRAIERIYLSSRSPVSARRLARTLSKTLDKSIEVTDVRSACERADIVVTVTTSRSPVLESDWIRPGTHISSMGSDQKGKQELPVELLLRSTLYADLARQSLEVGEFQHLKGRAAFAENRVVSIGNVLSGRAAGRSCADQITIFDSSGLAAQDLFIAKAILEQALESGVAVDVS